MCASLFMSIISLLWIFPAYIYIYIEKQTPHFELQFLVIMRGIARPSKDSKRQTQVVASLGPASWSEETLLASRAMPLSYLAGEA